MDASDYGGVIFHKSAIQQYFGHISELPSALGLYRFETGMGQPILWFISCSVLSVLSRGNEMKTDSSCSKSAFNCVTLSLKISFAPSASPRLCVKSRNGSIPGIVVFAASGSPAAYLPPKPLRTRSLSACCFPFSQAPLAPRTKMLITSTIVSNIAAATACFIHIG